MSSVAPSLPGRALTDAGLSDDGARRGLMGVQGGGSQHAVVGAQPPWCRGSSDPRSQQPLQAQMLRRDCGIDCRAGRAGRAAPT